MTRVAEATQSESDDAGSRSGPAFALRDPSAGDVDPQTSAVPAPTGSPATASSTTGASEARQGPATPRQNGDWVGWRGRHRDGRVAWLPDELPDEPVVLWEAPLASDGLGGIAVAQGLVIVGGRDADDQADVFTCLDAAVGLPLWEATWPAPGELDYGNSPRATPLIDKDFAWLAGAFGDLVCVRLETGETVWHRNMIQDFGAAPLTWGVAGSPLLIGNRLIVQPGAADAAVVALNRADGSVLWKTPGLPAGYSSFIVAGSNRHRHLVGYDSKSLGGWDINTGRRLWTLVPQFPGDFNVPTPVAVDGGFLVVSEGNGARQFRFDASGVPTDRPVAVNEELAPDSQTPVVAGQRIFGVWNGLHCLDLSDDLKTVWQAEDDSFFQYATLIASDTRVLVISLTGELILIDATADEYRVLDRLALSSDDSESLSHPAIVGDRLYIRIGQFVKCISLMDE